MEDLKGRAFVLKKLRSSYVRYVSVSALFLIVLSLTLLIHNRTASLDETVSNLEDLKMRLARSGSAVREVNLLINRTESVLPRGVSTEPPSAFLFAGLDRVKGTFGKAQLAIGKMETKADEAVMSVNIAGPMDDYRVLAGQIGRLQRLSFPFFTVSGLFLKKDRAEGGRESVFFEIRGVLRTPLITGDRQYAESPQKQGG